MFKAIRNLPQFSKSLIFINSSWGIVSQVFQSVLLSLFFIIIARNYSTLIFANFIIATALYQLIASFSSLGLSQWFIREISGTVNKKDLVNKFFKIQIYSGVFFYLVNIVIGFLLYDDQLIHILTILLGINIVFDNLINSIKCINIADFEQKKSFIILTADAVLKFAATCFLFIYPFSIITLSIIMVIVRFVTLNLFLSFGSTRLVNVKFLIQYKVTLKFIKQLISINWPFIIIGSVSIINWRIATLIVSKVLLPMDVAVYEISYRIFSVAIMLPVVVSTTVFPILINFFKEGKHDDLSSFYRKVHIYYLFFGLFSFTFIYSYIDFLLPIIFGLKYLGAGIYTKQMFLTILIFPTAFLQANVLVSLKLEKLDMWFNVISLIVNLTFSLVGVYFFRSLSVINISIFIGFVIFHILQDYILIKKNVCPRRNVFEFYILSSFIVCFFVLLNMLLNTAILFPIFWILVFCVWYYAKKYRRSNIL